MEIVSLSISKLLLIVYLSSDDTIETLDDLKNGYACSSR